MRTLRLGSIPWILVLGVALVSGLLVWQGLTYWGDRQQDRRRTDALTTAEAQVRDLISLNTDNVGEKLKALEGRTTGDFKRQVRGLTQVFVSTVEKQKISSEGRVVGAAVDTLDENRASVLVAATSEVSTVKDKASKTRGYRLRIALKYVKDRWLVESMEFVA